MITWHESDIEDCISEDVESVFGPGYRFLGRQVNIGIGIIDVLLFDVKTEELVIVEIKNKAVDNNALAQIMRYVAGVKDYVAAKPDLKINKVRGILLGETINQDTIASLRLIQDIVEFRELFVSILIDAVPHVYVRNEDDERYYNPGKFNNLLTESIGVTEMAEEESEQGSELE